MLLKKFSVKKKTGNNPDPIIYLLLYFLGVHFPLQGKSNIPASVYKMKQLSITPGATNRSNEEKCNGLVARYKRIIKRSLYPIHYNPDGD